MRECRRILDEGIGASAPPKAALKSLISIAIPIAILFGDGGMRFPKMPKAPLLSSSPLPSATTPPSAAASSAPGTSAVALAFASSSQLIMLKCSCPSPKCMAAASVGSIPRLVSVLVTALRT